VIALERGHAQTSDESELLPALRLPDFDLAKLFELLPGGAAKVFFCLASYSTWGTGKDIRPGLSLLAARARMTRRAVQRGIATLLRLGLIRQVRPATNRHAAEYAIPIVKARRPGAAGARAGEGSSSPARAVVPRKTTRCASCGDTGLVAVGVDTKNRRPLMGPCGCRRRGR